MISSVYRIVILCMTQNILILIFCFFFFLKKKNLSNRLKYVQNGNRRLFHKNQIPTKDWFRVLFYLLTDIISFQTYLQTLPFQSYGMYFPAFWLNLPIHNSLS